MSVAKKGKKISEEHKEKIKKTQFKKGHISDKKGIRAFHPCPICGKQKKEYYWNNKFQYYNRTCGGEKCIKKLMSVGRGVYNE